jgi:hypothetical protein
MKLHRIFQILIVVAWFLQLLSYFLPIPSWYVDPTFNKLMAYDGYGSVLSLDVPFLYSFPLWGFLIATVGMFFFQNWGRYLYLALWGYGWCSTLLFGIRLALPAQGFLSIALATLDGAILALVFLSPLRAAFIAVASPNPPVERSA